MPLRRVVTSDWAANTLHLWDVRPDGSFVLLDTLSGDGPVKFTLESEDGDLGGMCFTHGPHPTLLVGERAKNRVLELDITASPVKKVGRS